MRRMRMIRTCFSISNCLPNRRHGAAAGSNNSRGGGLGITIRGKRRKNNRENRENSGENTNNNIEDDLETNYIENELEALDMIEKIDEQNRMAPASSSSAKDEGGGGNRPRKKDKDNPYRPIDSGVDSALSMRSFSSRSYSHSKCSVSSSVTSASSSGSSGSASSSSSTNSHGSRRGSGTGSMNGGSSGNGTTAMPGTRRRNSSIFSVHSTDSGHSTQSLHSVHSHFSTDPLINPSSLTVPVYYPIYQSQLHARKSSTFFQPGVHLRIIDSDEMHEIYFENVDISSAQYGIEIYHNSGCPKYNIGNREIFGNKIYKNYTHNGIHQNLHTIVAAVDHYMETMAKYEEFEDAEDYDLEEEALADLKLEDLMKIKVLGRGGYAHVNLVRASYGYIYALKCINKSRVVAAGQRRHVKAEREILLQIDSNFILKLHKTFRDQKYVYLLTEALLGGELFTMMKRKGPLSTDITTFALACVLEAIEYLHKSKVVHRDVKPENMLLDVRGYVKLADFGFAKKLGPDGKTRTFCGTPGYLAPELLLKRPHGYSADFWSIGVFLFELLSCKSPFRRHTDDDTYRMTLKGIKAVEFPQCIEPGPAESIRKLCRPDPDSRLGTMGGCQELRDMPWFSSFPFQKLRSGKLVSPLKPVLTGPEDTSQFENFSIATLDDLPPDEISGWDLDF